MIEIITLGYFDITLDGKSIIKEICKSPKNTKLVKYLLVHQGMKLLPETIIDDLWPDEEIKNPISALRTQISRLRNSIIVEDIVAEEYFTIDYKNGYYVFKLKKESIIDFVELEKVSKDNCINLRQYINENPDKIYHILSSYKGELLVEIGDEDWIIPIRSRYDRLYVNVLSHYIDYLKENHMYSEIINICEKAIAIKPYEELIHVSFIEALLELEQNSYALIHYEFYTKKLFTDLKFTPSKKLKQVYKKIKTRDEETNLNIDLNKIDEEMLKEVNLGEIIYCNVEYFKILYNYEKRNKDRRIDKSVGTGIGIITIFNKGYEQLKEKEIKIGMDNLRNVLLKRLRSGDIVAKWNNNQMIIMLYGLRKEHIGSVVDKIKNGFDLEKTDERLSLNIKLNIL